MGIAISVIVPARDAKEHLGRCLIALKESNEAASEIIVIDDGSADGSGMIAENYGAVTLRNEVSKGPSSARNLGAELASGDVLLFIDSDVCVKTDTLQKICNHFNTDPKLDAIIGSYDSHPASPDFISQYRNLMHCYVHQTGAENASTFWSGCGAIRRKTFLEQNGFRETYKRPAIEDIELGYRLTSANRKIALDRSILVTHMKRWTFWKMLRTDVVDRGIPWSELILRDGRMPNDLNLEFGQRASVILVYIFIGLTIIMTMHYGLTALISLCTAIIFMLVRWWGERRGRETYVVAACMAIVLTLLAYKFKLFLLLPFLVITPMLLSVRHIYSGRGKLRETYRPFTIVFILCAITACISYLPANHITVAWLTVFALIVAANGRFYSFLARKRGITFMLAAIPLNFLYHFYNGISAAIGIVRYIWLSGAMLEKHAMQVDSSCDS